MVLTWAGRRGPPCFGGPPSGLGRGAEHRSGGRHSARRTTPPPATDEPAWTAARCLWRAGRAALSLRRTTQGAVSVRAPGRRSFLPASGTAPGFPSERPGDDPLSARRHSAGFFSESRSGRDPFRRDDPTVSGWKTVFPAQRPASSCGEASRPTGGGRPRWWCADGRRRGEDAPPGARRGFIRHRRRRDLLGRGGLSIQRPGDDLSSVQ